MNAESPEQITVYRPNQRHDLGWFQTWAVMARNIWNARELVWQLFKRDFFAQYKKSFIGFSWVFFSPIMGIISWVFLTKTKVLNPGDVGVPYTVYVIVGTTMWWLFLGFFNGARSTLSSGKALAMQVNYPHEALLFQQAARLVANFVLKFLMLVVVLLVFKVPMRPTILLFPVVLLPLFLMASAAGLFFSMFSIVAIDLNKIVDQVILLLMYASPIIYHESRLEVGDPMLQKLVSKLIQWNPLTHLVCSARDIVIYGRLYDTNGFLLWSALSVVAFLISWRLFFVSEDRIIEKMI